MTDLEFEVKSPYDDLLAKIKPLSERPSYIRAIIYGEAGAGKSVFCASAPNPLFLDIEHGTLSLLNHAEYSLTPVLPITKVQDVEEFFWAFKAGVFADIHTVVIDSVSEFQKLHMDKLLQEAHKKDPSKNNAYLPTQLAYKESGEYMRRILLAFRDLECNLLITAHVTEDKDESDGTIFLRPSVTPKLASTLEGAVDVLGYMSADIDGQTKKVVRRLQVQPTRKVRAKTRLNLPAYIENPKFSDLQVGLSDNTSL